MMGRTMNDTESTMSDGNNANMEILLVRIEGKIDRLGDRMNIFERDQNSLRTRVHDLANDVQVFVGLGLPDRIRVADAHNAVVDARLLALENLEHQRKGAAALAKVIYTVLGAVGVGGVAAVVRLLQVGGI